MATSSVQPRRPAAQLLKPVIGLIAGAAVLLIAGIVLAVVTTRQQPQVTFPPGSPEETVTTYLGLLQDGRVDEAFDMTALEEGPPYFETVTRDRFHERFDAWSQTPHRVTLLRSSTTGENASVMVEISSFRPDLFAAPEQTSQVTITLSKRGEGWVVTGPAYFF